MSVVATADHHGKSFEVKPSSPISEPAIQRGGELACIAAAGVPSLHELEQLLGVFESGTHRGVADGVHHPDGWLRPDGPQTLQRHPESGTELVQTLLI